MTCSSVILTEADSCSSLVSEFSAGISLRYVWHQFGLSGQCGMIGCEMSAIGCLEELVIREAKLHL